MTGANDRQIGGDHYKLGDIQTWDFIVANELDYFQGNIVKYVARWKLKGGREDLLKAKHYLDKYLEITEEAAHQEESRSTLGYGLTENDTLLRKSAPTPKDEQHRTAAEVDRMRGRTTVRVDNSRGILESFPESSEPQG